MYNIYVYTFMVIFYIGHVNILEGIILVFLLFKISF